MYSDSPLPMMETITISPLRLDIDRTIRLDRRWPQTQGFWWEKYEPEEEPVEVSEEEEPTYIIKDAYWLDGENNQIRDLNVDKPVTLYVLMEKNAAGKTIDLTFRDKEDGEVKTFKHSGTVDSDGIIVINTYGSMASN